LFEFSRTEPEELNEIGTNYQMLESAGFDVCILNTSYKTFGYKREMHIWIRPGDFENANLMILLGYIILGHPDWKKGFIKIFALYPDSEVMDKRDQLLNLIKTGRLPISPSNIEMVPFSNESMEDVISNYSVDADLTMIGFRSEMIKNGMQLFEGYPDLGNILFVSANKAKIID
jgi:hypothetical protein